MFNTDIDNVFTDADKIFAYFATVYYLFALSNKVNLFEEKN